MVKKKKKGRGRDDIQQRRKEGGEEKSRVLLKLCECSSPGVFGYKNVNQEPGFFLEWLNGVLSYRNIDSGEKVFEYSHTQTRESPTLGTVRIGECFLTSHFLLLFLLLLLLLLPSPSLFRPREEREGIRWKTFKGGEKGFSGGERVEEWISC